LRGGVIRALAANVEHSSEQKCPAAKKLKSCRRTRDGRNGDHQDGYSPGKLAPAVRWRPGWVIRLGFAGEFPLFLILALRDDNGIMASCIDAGEKQA
jgi:hypothetical protein